MVDQSLYFLFRPEAGVENELMVSGFVGDPGGLLWLLSVSSTEQQLLMSLRCSAPGVDTGLGIASSDKCLGFGLLIGPEPVILVANGPLDDIIGDDCGLLVALGLRWEVGSDKTKLAISKFSAEKLHWRKEKIMNVILHNYGNSFYQHFPIS